MTLQECYVKIGGDYNDILHRFMNENMIHKFVLKFPQDNNMALFEESVYFCPQHFNMIVAWRVMLYKIFHIMNCYGNEKGLFIRRNCII